MICHHDAPIDLVGLASWLAGETELVGIVRITEDPSMVKRRAKREWSRIGPIRFIDMLAFRFYYRFTLAAADHQWEQREIARLQQIYPAAPDVPIHDTRTPNSPQTQAFLEGLAPDLVLARCKFLLKKDIFTIPRSGTLVLHPGICPEYRNAHGCFWALANDDMDKVGVTLLKVDAGVDTGPVYGYFSYAFDEVAESHIRIQLRCVTENLSAIATAFGQIHQAKAVPMDTSGRGSAVWGQPWLTKYAYWKRQARRRAALRSGS
ncbi:MAG: formyltransferase family protein [Hyphomicrobiaceae bacterium]